MEFNNVPVRQPTFWDFSEHRAWENLTLNLPSKQMIKNKSGPGKIWYFLIFFGRCPLLHTDHVTGRDKASTTRQPHKTKPHRHGLALCHGKCWSPWHTRTPGGVPAGHPHYLSASTEEGCGCPKSPLAPAWCGVMSTRHSRAWKRSTDPQLTHLNDDYTSF